MKAKLIKENLRITTNYKKDMYPTVFTAPRLKPKVDSGPKFHDDLELNNQPIQNITL